MKAPSTIVIGLGNPILGDDGVGWQVAERVSQQLSRREGIEIDCLSIGGLSLMERLIGYDRALIIDAITTGDKPQGSVSAFNLSQLPNRALGHLCSSHDTTLQNALAVGRQMGAKLPSEIVLVAIEASQVYNFSETLSPAIASAVPKAVDCVISLL
jgi:hydrogenase maturation protease